MQQVVPVSHGSVGGVLVEVLDETYFDRCWRLMDEDCGLSSGDYIWWQSYNAFSGPDDKPVGRCFPGRCPTISDFQGQEPTHV